MRENISEHNAQMAEEIVPVGSLVSDALYVNDVSTKCFIMQGGNIVTLPSVISFGGEHQHTLDTHELLRVLYSTASTTSLDQLTDKYLERVQEGTKTEELMDEIIGFLTMSQSAVPVLAITQHPMSWRSRSIVPRYQSLDSVLDTESKITHQLYLSFQMNADMSIWHHFDALVEPEMTQSDTAELQERVSHSLLDIIRSGAGFVNVPSSLYNQ